MAFHVPENYRYIDDTYPAWAHKTAVGTNNGTFIVPYTRGKKPVTLRCIASDGWGWEHVSVSLPSRVPTWDEMCYIKELFWDDENWVVQYHPAKSEYVNCHPYVLHLWHPLEQELPTPPSLLVGPKHVRIHP